MDASGTPTGTGGKGSNNGGNNPTSSSSAAANAKLRKRTKTGCLTCRRRRIKCGEERPICSNCIKSKRTCEGYSQRISWKPPIGDWGGLAEDSQAMQYHAGMMPPPPTLMNPWRPVPPPIDTGGFMPVRMPQQGQPYAFNEHGEPLFSPPNSGMQFAPQQIHGLPMPSPQTAYPPTWTPVTPQYGQPVYGQSPMSAVSAQSLPPNFNAPTQHASMGGMPMQTGVVSNQEHMMQQLRRASQVTTDLPTPAASVQQEPTAYYSETPLPQQHEEPIQQNVPPHHEEPLHAQLAGPVCWWQTPGSADVPPSAALNDPWATTAGPNAGVPTPIISPTATAPHNAAKFLGTNLTGATAQFLEDAAVETHDDDYYDVESDEEMEAAPEKTFQQLSLMRRLHQDHLHEQATRSYDTFLYSGMLDHYRAEEHANPLGNPKTARVFAHFIFATGPSLSIFERHPRNPSALFNEAPSERSQGLWTYTLPMMALRHQGLLHAMLALSSLHISKLQGTSNMPSYKHYAYAIKRIHKSVGITGKKFLPTTIAATLLLGFYEILTADHLKWSSHLAGAKQLLQAIPFKRMARDVRRMKAQQLAQKDQFAFYDGHQAMDHGFRDISSTIDEGLVSNLMGRQVKVEQFGHVLDEDDDVFGTSSSTPYDIEKYEIYQDLYWWYARQDVYQAILSGNRLLLDYHRWTDCPPRASMGRPDAIYGTHDHLILLFARLADFNARDRKRKIKVMEANGGQWRPPPGMNIPSPPRPPPAQSVPQHANNPNAAYMHHGASQGQVPMPQQQHRPSMDPSAFAYGQGPSPNAAFSQGQMPQGFSGYPEGGNVPPFAGAGQQSTLPMHMGQGQTGTSPNFRHERAFNEASPNAPYSVQAAAMASASGQPPPQQAGPPQGGLPPQMPPFYGMGPFPTTVNMPSSFGPSSTPSPKSESSEYDLDAAMQAAIGEWSAIKAALNTFESHLGPHFQPMPADVHPATMTPFGPALFYRSHDVGIIWAMYYMALIILHRSHPSMPPAAMMAAGVAARQTAQYATRIGQVVGGVAPPVMGPDLTLSPNLGACLCEASLPLFFAGVQYGDPTQRAWLVNLLRNVEARTGWRSIGMVAQGCETAWEKAAAMGRGPPYTRRLDNWHVQSAEDPRVKRIISGAYPSLAEDGGEDSAAARLDIQGTRVHWAMGVLGVVEDGDESMSRHVSGVQPAMR